MDKEDLKEVARYVIMGLAVAVLIVALGAALGMATLVYRNVTGF